MPLSLQYAVIAVVVLASFTVVMRKQFPNATRRLRIACALPLLRVGRRSWLQRLGRLIAPPARVAGDASCGGCNGCGPD
jgi:hypothetical protein